MTEPYVGFINGGIEFAPHESMKPLNYPNGEGYGHECEARDSIDVESDPFPTGERMMKVLVIVWGGRPLATAARVLLRMRFYTEF